MTADGSAPEMTIELDAAEAAAGTIKTVTVEPGSQVVTIRIPPGIGEGALLRLPGLAGPGVDVLIRVRIRADSPLADGISYPQTAYHSDATSVPAPPSPPAAPRKANPKLVGGVVVVVLLALCCGLPTLIYTLSSGGSKPSPRAAGTSRASASPSSSPSPVPSPVSADGYQQLLATLDHDLGPAFQQVGAAHTPPTVRDAVRTAQDAMLVDIDKLTAIAPPTAAQTAHAQFVSALTGLSTVLGQTISAAEARSICAGSSALARISQGFPAEQFRTAAKALATADPAHAYQVGAFLPAASPDANRRLGNGTFVKKAARGGSGHLKIENGGSGDAAISVVPANSKTPTLTVYVRGNSNYTVTNVHDGTYEVFLATGSDWDTGTKTFTRDCEYQQFDDSFEFTTTSSQFTEWSITLTPVVGGNARTSNVDPGSYPSG